MQVNPLGVAHTLTTRVTSNNDQNNLQNIHSKIFGRMQNVTAVREVPFHVFTTIGNKLSLFTRLLLTVLCQAY